MTIRTMWQIGQQMEPNDWPDVIKIIGAALAWGRAREAVLAEDTADVRKSDSFRARLEALATAERDLYAAVRVKEDADAKD